MLYYHDSDSGVCILGLLGMELIFFIAVCMVLWFRVVTKTVLFNIAMFCLTVLAQHQALLCSFTLLPQQVGCWGGKEVRKGHSQDS